MLILLRGFAALFDLAFVFSYLFALSFAMSSTGLADKDGIAMYLLEFGFPLVYFGCLDSERCGAGTIGKRLLGLQVRATGGEIVPLYTSLARNILKLGLPVLTFKLAGGVVVMRGWTFIGTACIFAVVLIFPVSVFVGRGAVGIHDRLVKTYVVRRRSAAAFPGSDYLTYWLLTAVLTAAVAFSFAALLRNLIGPNTPEIRTVLQQTEPALDVAKEIWLGQGSEAIRPYVTHVDVLASVGEFPTDYSKSFSKLPDVTLKALKGNPGAATVIVYLSKQGSSQHNLRTAVIERVATAATPKLVGTVNLPTFMWLAFAVESDFGPLQLTQAEYGILIVNRQGNNPGTMTVVFAEPSRNRYSAVGSTISGLTFPREPF